jgi:two-component system KDP operon response regulator KdpE
MRAVNRRQPESVATQERIGRYDVDLGAYVIRDRTDPNRVVHLTHTEWRVLEFLLRNPRRLISQRQPLQSAWGPTYESETNYLRQFIKQLRMKLEDEPAHPKHLLTEPGMGYRLQP